MPKSHELHCLLICFFTLSLAACNQPAPTGPPPSPTEQLDVAPDPAPGDYPLPSGGDYNPAPLSAEEVAAGWISLFDGHSFFGWKTTIEADWKIKDQTIVVTKSEAPGLLYTTTQFSNYVLKVDFRAAEGTNSGIFLATPPEPTDPAKDCYELNIAPVDNPFPTGSLVKRTKIKGSYQSDDWQTYEVTVADGKIEIKLNDESILTHTDPRPLGRGHIGLQYNSGKVEFRNVKLKPLGAKSLFNGKDLAGWTEYPEMASVYSVTEAGELNVKNGRGQLETKTAFGDFALQLDCFINGDKLNSGIFFRCMPGDEMMGYECQVSNATSEDDPTKPGDCGSGGFFRRQDARRIVAKDREWYSMTLIADGPHMAAWVNGYQVSDWTDEREPNENPRRGLRLEPGTIMLQGHDPTTDISFRNLRLGVLAPRRE